MSNPPQWPERFIAHLHELAKAEDRAALAHLRRGLGKPPGTVAVTHRLVQPWLPPGLSRRDEDAAYLVASLFAAHPVPGGQKTLGHAFRTLSNQRESDSIEARFVALLNAHEDDLPKHLRHAVSLLAAEGIAIDWLRLLKDVRFWSGPQRLAQRDWARDYWTGTAVAAAG